MNTRQQLIEDVFQHMTGMRRVFFAHHSQSHVKSKGPTHAQLGILFLLGCENLGVKDLATRFGMSSSAVTQLMTGLVNQGYIRKELSKEDRRKSQLTLTAKGEQLLKKRKEERLKQFTERLASLSETELRQLKKIQEKILL